MINFTKKPFYIILTWLLLSSVQAIALDGYFDLAKNAYVSYTSASGIGNNSGYTTLGGFAITTESSFTQDALFGDLRVHFFDRGKMAVNVGGGIRFDTGPIIYGANVYYDYRDTFIEDYNQLGLGIEILGQCFDIRANGYIPLGSTRSPSTVDVFEFPNGFFVKRREFQYSFWGADIEIGAPINFSACPKNIANFYLAAGPYYLSSDRHKDFYGVRVRLVSYINQYLRIEGRLTHDRVFKTKGQGVVYFELPFTTIRNVICGKTICCSSSDCCSSCIDQRLYEPVFRNEIIPVRNHCGWHCNYDCF